MQYIYSPPPHYGQLVPTHLKTVPIQFCSGTLIIVPDTDGAILAQTMSPEAIQRCTARDHVSRGNRNTKSDHYHLP